MDRNLRVDALSECRGLAVFAERVIRQVPSHAFFVHAGLDPDQWPTNELAIAGGDAGIGELHKLLSLKLSYNQIL